jgi:uncharacterized membrane-anchored protein
MTVARDIPAPPEEAVVGRALVDRRTKDLIKRLQPGDIAVIDHEDLDRIAAEGLVEARVGAVVNAAPSISGRYPNLGPLLIAAARIPLIDDVGPEIMDAVHEGQTLTISGGHVMMGDLLVAEGRRQTLQSLELRLEEARGRIGEELERFAENTLEYLRRERHLFVDPPDLPDTGHDMKGRHVLIVVRGIGYKHDLAVLRQGGYLRDVRPVLVGVDGGADALLEIGEKPDFIVGDFDSVSEEALRCGATLVVHAYPGGKAPGAKRLDDLGLDYVVFEAGGTSEDIAMLLAYERGAELIVAVGTHNSMVEFLDKGRPGMASTFLVRMKVSEVLVDAKGVSRLYQSRVSGLDLALLVLAAFFTMLVVATLTEADNIFVEGLRLFRDRVFG